MIERRLYRWAWLLLGVAVLAGTAVLTRYKRECRVQAAGSPRCIVTDRWTGDMRLEMPRPLEP